MKKWKQIVLSVMVASGIGAVMLQPAPAQAINVFGQCGSNGSSAVCKSQGDDAKKTITNVINIILTILGMIAVIMIVIGGIRYTTSNGNASQTKEAKDTIIYAVIGIVVAVMSYAIVNFVISRL